MNGIDAPYALTNVQRIIEQALAANQLHEEQEQAVAIIHGSTQYLSRFADNGIDHAAILWDLKQCSYTE